MFMCVAITVVGVLTGQHQMPAGMSHDEHLKKMDALNARGAMAMGFDQKAAVHHFAIEPEGGTISVAVKDRSDERTRVAIRTPLKTIAAEFARGDFSSPVATHSEMPPGARDMQRLKADLRYTFESTPDGGRVVIRTSNIQAVKAVHEFLRYQIVEHETGDPTSEK